MKGLEEKGTVSFFILHMHNMSLKQFSYLGFKLFDVKESFGRSMEDIRGKVVKVSYFGSYYYYLLIPTVIPTSRDIVILGENPVALVLGMGEY